MDDQILKKYGYVIVSSYRIKTIKVLKDKVKTPTQIAKDAEFGQIISQKFYVSLKRVEWRSVLMRMCEKEDFID